MYSAALLRLVPVHDGYHQDDNLSEASACNREEALSRSLPVQRTCSKASGHHTDAQELHQSAHLEILLLPKRPTVAKSSSTEQGESWCGAVEAARFSMRVVLLGKTQRGHANAKSAATGRKPHHVVVSSPRPGLPEARRKLDLSGLTFAARIT